MHQRPASRTVLLVPLFWLLVPGTPEAAERSIVAVFDIQNQGAPIQGRILKRMADYLATSLVASGRFEVVPRDQLRKRLIEQKKASYKACYDQSCQIELGRELAADQALATKVMRIGKTCVVTSSLFDLKRVTAGQGATMEGGCSEEDIMASIKGIVARLTGARPETTGDVDGCKQGDFEDCSARCDAGDGASCRTLAVMYRDGDGVHKNRERAREMLRTGCERGRMKDCGHLSHMALYGWGGEQDKTEGVRLARQACQAGVGAGCLTLGHAYKGGLGVKKDGAEGEARYLEACGKGAAVGCFLVAKKYYRGRGVARDYSRAAKLFQRACEDGHMSACTHWAELYEHGRGVTKDTARMAELYRKACAGGHMFGCYKLGWCYHQGLGVRYDGERAVNLFRKACEGKAGAGCYNLAICYTNGQGGLEKDKKQVAKFHRKACTLGIATSCWELSSMYWRGDGVPKDPEEGKRLTKRACELGFKHKSCE